MEKRIVIADCRDYNNFTEAEEFINFCIKDIKNKYSLIFISGNCSGTDLLGEKFAYKNNYKTELYPANWEKYGRAAGPKRNEEMAKIADYIICFWYGKGRGTKSMIGYAKKYNKPIKIKIIQIT